MSEKFAGSFGQLPEHLLAACNTLICLSCSSLAVALLLLIILIIIVVAAVVVAGLLS